MITLVVVGYNRPQPLQRLLDCINRADYGDDYGIHLVISLDRADNCDEMKAIADSFDWTHGDKEVILHEKRLGLREHFLFCGDLTQKYGSICFLEDDIYVLPGYYKFAKACVERYENDDRLLGASLYSIRYNETAHRPFLPFNDGSDVFFLKLMTWAPIYFPKQWKAFREWYNKEPKPMEDITCLPDNARIWKMTSFKKYHVKYSITHDKYFVYPHISYTTNFAEAGQHYVAENDNLQVPLILNTGMSEFRLASFDESLSIYDEFMEILPKCIKHFNPDLNDYDFAVDLYGNKRRENVDKPYCITSDKCKDPIMTWGCKTVPHETNVMLNVPGNYFKLANTDDINFSKPRGIYKSYATIAYDIKGTSPLKAIETDWRIFLQQVGIVKSKVFKKKGKK